jgi:hypothetical protein
MRGTCRDHLLQAQWTAYEKNPIFSTLFGRPAANVVEIVAKESTRLNKQSV